MPNTVVPGNHDFNNATGAFTQYDDLLPAVALRRKARGRRAPPATAATSARTCSGPTRWTARNMDNFALFTAGGRDFLVLNLEWEAPQYALDWADRGAAGLPRPHRDHDHPQLRPAQRSAQDHAGASRRHTRRHDVDRLRLPAVLDPAGAQRPLPQRRPRRGAAGPTSTAAASRCSRSSPTTRTAPTAATAGCATTRSTRPPNTMTRDDVLAEAEPVRDRRRLGVHPAVRPRRPAARPVRHRSAP